MSAVRSMSLWAFPPTWQRTTRPSESSRRRRSERLTSRVSWSSQSRRTLGLATTRSQFQWRRWCWQGIAWAPLGARNNSLRTRRVRRKLSQRLPKEWQWKATQRILGIKFIVCVCVVFWFTLILPTCGQSVVFNVSQPLARRSRYIKRSNSNYLTLFQIISVYVNVLLVLISIWIIWICHWSLTTVYCTVLYT